MLISYKWLQALIDFKLTVEELSELLTNTGLEVEKVHMVDSIKGGLKGLVVGKVLSCGAHPNADRLTINSVDIGLDEALQIVCGAPNVAVDQKVVVAPVGCMIHPINGDAFTIKKAKIRGVESFGMICAEDEIGLGESHDGILVLNKDAQIGRGVDDYYNLESDYQLEIGLTPNRGDAISHIGVARDVKAITGVPVKWPEVRFPKFNGDTPIQVELVNPEMCPRYSGILLNNIRMGESPDWIKKRLQSIDLKSINNVVDVTNYVLHEVGQPIHAFDADKVEGGIIRVRPSIKGEKIKTLDEVDRTLTGQELLIADTKKPLAIAGVFGGFASGITNETTSVFIESAYFDPGTIRKSAKVLGLSTDASFRYERGCDPDITTYALNRVVDLLREAAGAEVASSVIDVYPKPLRPASIGLDLSWLNFFFGTKINKTEVVNILQLLDFQITKNNKNHLELTAPLYRSDVTRAVDVAEEVLRIYGYNKVEIPKRLSFTASVAGDKTMLTLQSRIAQFLNGQGFLEIMNNSLTKREDAGDGAVAIMNPLSAELEVMRTSLLPGALSSVAHNLNRKKPDLLFYEFGKTYGAKKEKYFEPLHLCITATGSTSDSNWTTASSQANYYFFSGLLEALASHLGLSQRDLEKVSTIASVPPQQLKIHDIKQTVWSCMIDMDKLFNAYQKATFTLTEIPKYPVVVRDVSAIVDQATEFKEIDKFVRNACGSYIQKINVFDVYRGEQLPKGKKSYAFSIYLYDPAKTMTDDVTESLMKKVIEGLENKLGALIRK